MASFAISVRALEKGSGGGRDFTEADDRHGKRRTSDPRLPGAPATDRTSRSCCASRRGAAASARQGA